MEAEIKDLQVDEKLAKIELKTLKKKLDNGVITSTVNGTVKSVIDEEEAKLGDEPLIRVIGEDGLYITGSIAEVAVEKMDPGMSVTVTSWETGETYEATVTDVGHMPISSSDSYSGNPNMSYYAFTAVVHGEADLQSGESVGISVDGMTILNPEEEIYISQAFVRKDGNGYYVYKKGESNRLQKQYVEIGKIVYGTMEIQSGISQEDEIAFPYGKDVKEGARTKTVDSLYDEVDL